MGKGKLRTKRCFVQKMFGKTRNSFIIVPESRAKRLVDLFTGLQNSRNLRGESGSCTVFLLFYLPGDREGYQRRV